MTIAIILTAFVLFSSAALAFFSRMDGGGEPKTPEVVERLLCISPFLLLGFLLHPIALLPALFSYAGRATGHGQYFPDVEGKTIPKENTEFIDPLVSLFFGKDPRVSHHHPISQSAIKTYGLQKLKLRCFFGMCLTGLMVSLPLSMTALVLEQPLIAALLFLSGIGKGVAYQISHTFFNSPTLFAEYLNGFQQGLFVFSSIAILLVSYIMNSQ